MELVHCSMSSSNYCFLTCIQVSQEAGKFVWYSYLFKNSLICCDPHKGFSVVNEAEEYTWFIQTMSPECLTGKSSVMRFKILNLLFLHLFKRAGVCYLSSTTKMNSRVKELMLATSLVVQWLRLCLSMQGCGFNP